MDYFSAGLGGIGLFLLGMWLITEGLRLAAGASLERLLASWTSSKPRGLASGILLTALLQSSSIVTVAVIGFVNAGLMKFQRAVWVIFGSNLGTTLTAWLVALVGFKLKIDAFALPVIGLGALLRVFSPVARHQSLGMALAGFGILFLGIETLSGGLSSLSTRVTLGSADYSTLFMLVLGIMLTALMMSSSAAMALALTALASGVLTFTDAAAVVIGTNIGTTITAIIAALGATASARRLAAVHVLFNLLTGAVALTFLEPLLRLVVAIGELAGYENEPTTLLAMFHTLFNVLGILLMWPLEPGMSQFLLSRFGNVAPGATLTHLDRNVAAVPDAVPAALCRELAPLLHAAPDALAGLPHSSRARQADSRRRRQHLDAISEFIATASRYPFSGPVAEQLAQGWRVQHNLSNVEETLQHLDTLAEAVQRSADQRMLTAQLEPWFGEVAGHLRRIQEGQEGPLDFVVLVPMYEKTKQALLHAALAGDVDRRGLDLALQMTSLSRRYVEQWLRALSYWRGMAAGTGSTPGAAEVAVALPTQSPEEPEGT